MRPDFTLTERADAYQCAARPPMGTQYICTRIVGHSDYHAAGTGEIIVATWDEGQAYADRH